MWIPRLFNVKSGCVCRNRRYFRLFRYTLTQNRAVHTEPPIFCVEDARHFRQHRTIPALWLKHRPGSCGTASALPKCSIMSGCGTRIVLRGQKPLALCDRCPCFGSLFPPLAALTFAASSIICAFGLAAAAPRSPYRHLELCGIAFTFCSIIPGGKQGSGSRFRSSGSALSQGGVPRRAGFSRNRGSWQTGCGSGRPPP